MTNRKGIPADAPAIPFPVGELIAKLNEARGSIAYDKDYDNYEEGHYERTWVDRPFNDLIDFVLTRTPVNYPGVVVKPLTAPDLKPGDVVVVDDTLTVVRSITFHAPRTHPGSGVPAHQPAMKTEAGDREFWTALVPAPHPKENA